MIPPKYTKSGVTLFGKSYLTDGTRVQEKIGLEW